MSLQTPPIGSSGHGASRKGPTAHRIAPRRFPLGEPRQPPRPHEARWSARSPSRGTRSGSRATGPVNGPHGVRQRRRVDLFARARPGAGTTPAGRTVQPPDAFQRVECSRRQRHFMLAATLHALLRYGPLPSLQVYLAPCGARTADHQPQTSGGGRRRTRPATDDAKRREVARMLARGAGGTGDHDLGRTRRRAETRHNRDSTARHGLPSGTRESSRTKRLDGVPMARRAVVVSAAGGVQIRTIGLADRVSSSSFLPDSIVTQYEALADSVAHSRSAIMRCTPRELSAAGPQPRGVQGRSPLAASSRVQLPSASRTPWDSVPARWPTCAWTTSDRRRAHHGGA